MMMQLSELVGILDNEFFKTKVIEDLTAWSMTDITQAYVEQNFINKSTGLMFKFNNTVEKVFTCVFVTDSIINKICDVGNSLLFAHHNFDYYEDKRGLMPISLEQIKRLKNSNISLYVAHAGLDTHQKYGTSKALAEVIGMNIENYFFDYFGAPTALIGRIPKQQFEEFIEKAKLRMRRENLTIEKHREHVEKVAVIAGGGDEPVILEQAYNLGCDTFIGGTIDNKWGIPFIQENNKKFRQLNESLKLNLIGGTHYGTERFAMIKIVDYFSGLGLPSMFVEDEELFNTL